MSNQASEYPPYSCSCCGVTNGDMFWDYIQANAEELTYAKVVELCDEFDVYRNRWNAHAKDTVQSIKDVRKRRPYTKTSPYWEAGKNE